MTYLLEDYRGKPVAGGVYELHSIANPDVYLIEKVLCKKGNDVLREMAGI